MVQGNMPRDRRLTLRFHARAYPLGMTSFDPEGPSQNQGTEPCLARSWPRSPTLTRLPLESPDDKFHSKAACPLCLHRISHSSAARLPIGSSRFSAEAIRFFVVSGCVLAARLLLIFEENTRWVVNPVTRKPLSPQPSTEDL